ncbi:DUF6894 family protein [Methylobacterium sp. ID0610]|uniref:DUF6894 family protein n=1 Tax=Methylobacterium carpenticola TaxID=3344827 RepID=UPI0036956F95
MPLFYFHLKNGDAIDRDEVGTECPSLEAAYLEACRALVGMAIDMIRAREDPMRLGFEITDARGQALMEVPLSDALKRGRRPCRPPSPAAALGMRAQGDRTARLIGELTRQQAVLQGTLAETQRLLAQMRR